jgi:hypothetical protein
VDFIGTLDGLYMNFVESMGSPWKPVGDCKVQRITRVISLATYFLSRQWSRVSIMRTGAVALAVTDPSVVDVLISPPRTTRSWGGVLVLLTRTL